jgi:S-adenosylmethionine:tRNA ribosyltransferase-isomerase
VIAEPATRFILPADLNAAEPPEARGVDRDHVRLLVAGRDGIEHTRFDQLGRFLEPGDLLVVNTSGTLPAAVDGTRTGGRVVVHFSTALDDGDWVVELRTAPGASKPVLDAMPGERVGLPGTGELTLCAPYTKDERRLWRARIDVPGDVVGFLGRYGRPIAYAYVGERWPLASYQTVFATEPGSAEMPSAGRPFSTGLVTRLVSAGVLVAPIMLHTGVSSLESHEPPAAERFAVPATTAELVTWTKARGHRVVAVGTTVVRALESAVRPDGTVGAAGGWTELVLGPEQPARVVDGLVTGMHAPDASHLLLLEAVAGPELVQRAYDEALAGRYLWHEFGDLCLLLP